MLWLPDEDCKLTRNFFGKYVKHNLLRCPCFVIMVLSYWEKKQQLEQMVQILTVAMILDDDDDDGLEMMLLFGDDNVPFFLFDNNDDDFVLRLMREVRDLMQDVYAPLLPLERNFDVPDLIVAMLPNAIETKIEYRFHKNDLQEVMRVLWPLARIHLTGVYERVELPNRNYVHFECGMLMLLYRLAYPQRIYPEMVRRFNASPTRISYVINHFAKVIYTVAIPYLNNIAIFQHRIPGYAAAVKAHTGYNINVFGFLDGTLRQVCRPKEFQRQVYSGHKRKHGLKYQSVYLPDGMYGHFAGPFLGSSHDSSMLTESGLREELENLFPNEDYHIYVDPAYPQSAYIFGAIRSVHGIPLTREQQQFNTSFSSVRETVEFGFKEITQQFAYTDFKATQKIYKTPVGCFYISAVFLQNLRTTLYSNQTAMMLNVAPPSLLEYIHMTNLQ